VCAFKKKQGAPTKRRDRPLAEGNEKGAPAFATGGRWAQTPLSIGGGGDKRGGTRRPEEGVLKVVFPKNPSRDD